MYKKYVWYKVWYKFTAKYNGKTYEAFEFVMNTNENPNYINTVINKYDDNFIKVTEWII